MKNLIATCPVPVAETKPRLSSAARVKETPCGKDAPVICEAPIIVQTPQGKALEVIIAPHCLEHAAILATNKMIDRLPVLTWTAAELLTLIDAGCLLWDLLYAASFPSELKLSAAELALKTESVKWKIKEQCKAFRAHPNFLKDNSTGKKIIYHRLSLLESLAE